MSDKVKVAVLVSGGGTNLQALIDKEKSGELAESKIVRVIASKDTAYALQRAADAGIETSVAKTQEEVLRQLEECGAELVVLAG